MSIRARCIRGLSLSLLGIAAMASALAAEPAPGHDAPLKEVPTERDYELRVLYLEDPRLPTIDAKQRAVLFRKVENLLSGWFGYRARLREVGAKNLGDYFAAHAGVFQKHAEVLRLDLNPERASDRDRLRAVIQRALTQPGSGVAQDLEVTLATEQFLKRLAEIRSIPLPNGSTFADPARPELNSYMHWCALTHEMTEADLVFTNSMIAGADAEMQRVVIMRGGITTGNTNANPHNSFGAAAMVGLFPFLSDAPFWMRERGAIPEAERLDVIATMTMHELGHMLLRRAHPIDHKANCVSTPLPGLRYYDWHVAIRKDGPCLLPHPKLKSY